MHWGRSNLCERDDVYCALVPTETTTFCTLEAMFTITDENEVALSLFCNTYFGFYILTVWRVEPRYVPLAISPRFWCIRICFFVWWVVFVATFVTAALKQGFRIRKRKRKRNTESVKEGLKKKNIINDNKINKQI